MCVQVTRADVEVQPYAFTTKSLFVGHMDYKYLRWQVSVRQIYGSRTTFNWTDLILYKYSTILYNKNVPKLMFLPDIYGSVFVGGWYPWYSGSPSWRKEYHRNAGHHRSGSPACCCPLRHGCVRAVRTHACTTARAVQQYTAIVCQQGMHAYKDVNLNAVKQHIVLLGWMMTVIIIYVMQPLIVMANKCDVKKISELSEENQVNDILILLIQGRNSWSWKKPKGINSIIHSPSSHSKPVLFFFLNETIRILKNLHFCLFHAVTIHSELIC